jgi:hypothetical protein
MNPDEAEAIAAEIYAKVVQYLGVREPQLIIDWIAVRVKLVHNAGQSAGVDGVRRALAAQEAA